MYFLLLYQYTSHWLHYDAAFLYNCWFLFITIMELRCKYAPFWQEFSVKSLMLRWSLKPVGLLFVFPGYRHYKPLTFVSQAPFTRTYVHVEQQEGDVVPPSFPNLLVYIIFSSQGFRSRSPRERNPWLAKMGIHVQSLLLPSHNFFRKHYTKSSIIGFV